MPSEAPSLLCVRDVCVYFPGSGRTGTREEGLVRAVDGVSFDVSDGESFGVVGESGSGKTTLGRAIVGLTPPTSGTIEFDGRDLARVSRREARTARRQIQVVFQDAGGSLNPRLRIGTSVAEPMAIQRVGTRAERRRRVSELLEQVGLRASDASRFPHELSGGQRQRVGIARAISVNPRLVILDEPVSALDVSIQAQILQLLMDLQRVYRMTYLFIAHNLAVVRQFCDRVAVMQSGKIVEVADSPTLFTNPQHAYTRKLLSSVPNPDRYRQAVAVGADATAAG